MTTPPPHLAFRTRCWNCGETHDAASATDESGARPSNGDVTMCFDCGVLAIFDSAYEENIRKPTPAENFELKQHKELVELQRAWALHMLSRNKG
jgi:hypothetical protein